MVEVDVKKYSVYDCCIVPLEKIHNPQGNITVLENSETIPFEMNRIYYLYDIPSGQSRGGHAHFKLEQYIVAAGGSFDVLIDDGLNKRSVYLNRPNLALHVKPGIWRELDNFSSGAICLVFASLNFEESDYIRDYKEFIRYKDKVGDS